MPLFPAAIAVTPLSPLTWDMEAVAIGIEETIADDHMRARVGQVQYLGEKLRDRCLPGK